MTDSKAMVLEGTTHDLGGGMMVRRLLPQVDRRMIGPFAFFDHMGPFTAEPGQNTDVRPHPHIGLSTLTYLFDGRMVHRDSLGSVATILPGEVNWMTAGRGISHSERAHDEDRDKSRLLHGLQFWIALPDETEDCEPNFQHYGHKDVPSRTDKNMTLTMAAGEGFDLRSNVQTSSPLILATVKGRHAGVISIDFPEFEVGIYVVEGSVACGDQKVNAHQLFFLPKGTKAVTRFSSDVIFMIFGGVPFATPRHIWWNLVSSSKEKIEFAKQQWKSGTFPMVPGETEFIPLPEN